MSAVTDEVFRPDTKFEVNTSDPDPDGTRGKRIFMDYQNIGI